MGFHSAQAAGKPVTVVSRNHEDEKSSDQMVQNGLHAADMAKSASESSSQSATPLPAFKADAPSEDIKCLYGCGKKFSKSYLRNKHHKVHNPPHDCPYCGRRFAVTRDK
jgi:predicted flap endonuclease-1-like 5' DNA nuclease